MDLFQALILGIIQGITAWIPVSSKTQVLLFGTLLFGLSFEELIAFALIVHIGDIIALLITFRKEYVAMLKTPISFSDVKRFDSLPEEKKVTYFTIVSVLVTGVVALPLYLLVKDSFSEMAGTVFLLVLGILMLVMTIVSYLSHGKKTDGKITLKSAVITGFFQAFSVLPGISRSGSTEAALLLQRIKQEDAVRLAFIIGTPMIILALLAFSITDGFGRITPEIAIVGIIASTVSAYVTMNVMIELAKRVKFYWFTLILGLLAMVPFFIEAFL